MADEEGEFSICEEGTLGDAVAEEEGGCATDGTRTYAGNSVRGRVAGEAEVEAVA